MQMRWGAVVLCVLACARELALPNVTPLNATPATATVAPREPLQITAAGGTPPYAFALQQKQSGDRAAVSAAGAYQAGDDGPAADVVRLTDSTGAHVDVAVAVGPSLTLSPASALVAPGGRVVFTATGGKRLYAYSLLDGPGKVGAAGDYVAASGGDTVSHVQVRDATPDAAAAVEVHVGPAVSILPRTGAVAPYATLDFTAIGGQPPYRYAVQTADGATVDAETGHFQAGTGSGASAVQDTVTVTDALQQTASAAIQTGPPLAAQAPSELHPFKPIRLVPSGGLPPYSFAFAARGNRTRATLDAVTGVYTPGSNFAASDVIEIRDATPGGRALQTLAMPKVGSLELAANLSRNCLAADMDGDGREDVVLVTPVSGNGPSHIDIQLMVQDAPPAVIHNNIPDIRSALAADLNGDGRADLIVQDGTTIRAYLSNSDGSLAPSILLASKLLTNTAAPMVVSSASGVHSIYYRDTVPDASLCGGSNPAFMRVSWNAGASGPAAAAACVAPAKVGPFSAGFPAIGDFNHDGTPDLAWADGGGSLHVYFGPNFFTATPPVIALPAGYGFTGLPLVTDLDGDGIDDFVSLAARSSDGKIGLVSMKGSAGALALGPWTDSFPPTDSPVGNLIAAPGHELLGWTRIDGAVFRVGADLLPKDPQPSVQPFVVSCVALPDINADGAADLLASGNGSNTAVVIPGDGDGTYGRRPHFFLGQNQIAVDVDKDGVDDVVYRSGPFTLQTLFGGGHQLALGPETTFDSSFTFYLAPLYGSAVRDLLLFIGSRDWSMARAMGDGTWAPPEVIHDASGPRSSNFGISPAELGGAAPGGDFLEIENDGVTLIPLIRDDAGHPSLVTALPPISLPGTNCQVVLAGVIANRYEDFDGDGISDILEQCDQGNYVGRGAGAGAAISFSWTNLPDLPLVGSLFIGPRMKSGRVPVLLAGGSSVMLGSLNWNGTSFDLALANAPDVPHSITIPTLQPVNLGDGAGALLVGRDRLFEYREAIDGTFTFVRAFTPGASSVALAPSPGGPVDLLLSAKTSFTQSKEATLFVNDGSGNFP